MILTVTLNPAVDHTLSVGEQPRPGRVTRAETGGQFDAGGKGINVSQYLAALSSDTVATGLLGGFTGEYIRSVLAEEPFETAFVELPAPTRINTTVLATDGEYKFNENGPAADDAAIDALIERIRAVDPDRVAIAGSLPPGLDGSAIDRLARAGPWRTSVDVGGDLLTRLDAGYETCKPNRGELAAATGRDIDSVADAVAAARDLLDSGYERIVTSLGGDGAVLVTADRALYADAPAVEVVDTVGAGDSLFAGVLSALDRGESESEALRTGVAVASAVVGTTGTTPPRLDALDRDRIAVGPAPAPAE